jgi:predicted RNA-binding Zn ribbon-like protein
LDEDQKRQVGEQVEPGGRPKAPGRLELLQRFINTWNHELPEEWDRLGTPSRTRAWLRQKQLVSPKAQVTTGDAARLRAFREAIRSLVVAHVTGQCHPATVELLRAASLEAPLIVTIADEGRAGLRAQRDGIDGVIATLLAILYDAQLGEEWQRLKGCGQCGYAFFDRSKNRSATWCSMSICGNRSKNRAYYWRNKSVRPSRNPVR